MHRDDQAALFVIRKKHEVVQLLDSLCRQIEISEPQYQRAKTKYEEVSSWLAESNSPYLDQAEIYPQGPLKQMSLPSRYVPASGRTARRSPPVDNAGSYCVSIQR